MAAGGGRAAAGAKGSTAGAKGSAALADAEWLTARLEKSTSGCSLPAPPPHGCAMDVTDAASTSTSTTRCNQITYRACKVIAAAARVVAADATALVRARVPRVGSIAPCDARTLRSVAGGRGHEKGGVQAELGSDAARHRRRRPALPQLLALLHPLLHGCAPANPTPRRATSWRAPETCPPPRLAGAWVINTEDALNQQSASVGVALALHTLSGRTAQHTLMVAGPVAGSPQSPSRA